jgi:hypothetical protein
MSTYCELFQIKLYLKKKAKKKESEKWCKKFSEIWFWSEESANVKWQEENLLDNNSTVRWIIFPSENTFLIWMRSSFEEIALVMRWFSDLSSPIGTYYHCTVRPQ